MLGSGSWGTALAIQLARNGHSVQLWGHEPEAIDKLIKDKENRRYLPGITLPEAVSPCSDLADTVNKADEIPVVVPSHAFATVLQQIAEIRPSISRLSWATKGLEPQSNRLLHEVATEIFPAASLAAVSGPTFAGEVARGLPTAITVAATHADHADRLTRLLHGDNFRVYTSDDLPGVELGGAAKNVMAIAAGISDGLGFGANARAALITRGLAEITRLGVALGGKHDTFMGLTGMGDLVLTCTDDQSRNRRLGLALARNISIIDAMDEIGQEVEGVVCANELHEKSLSLGIDMPITQEVYQVLHHGKDPHEAVHSLLARHQKAE